MFKSNSTTTQFRTKAFERPRRSTAHPGVPEECRDKLVHALGDAMPEILDKAQKALFDLIDVTDERDARNQYLTAHEQLPRQREVVVTTFFRALRDGCNRALSGAAPRPAAQVQSLDAGLSLVDDDVLDATIAVEKLAQSLRAACDDELTPLERRVRELLQDPDLDATQNPFGPTRVADALSQALDSVDIGARARQAMFKLFEAPLVPKLKAAYRTVNDLLEDRGVDAAARTTTGRAAKKTFDPGHGPKPDMNDVSDVFTVLQKIMARRKGAHGTTGMFPAASADPMHAATTMVPVPGVNQALATTQAAGVQGVPGQPGYAIGPNGQVIAQPGMPYAAAGHPGMTHSGVFQQGGMPPGMLQTGMMPGTPTMAPGAAPGAVAGPGMATGGIPVVAAPGQAMQWLTGLQQGRADVFTQFAIPVAPEAAASGRVNVLRDIKSSAIGTSMGDMEGLTIDIVAMVFDYVFEDERIPDTIKAMLGRLQIPVLKIAVIDKTFFSWRGHPVRKLLDALAAAAVGWTGAPDVHDPLYAKIDGIVQRILGEFDTDVAMFSELHVEFERWLEQYTSSQAGAAESILEEREQMQSARHAARREIEQRLRQRAAPPAITQFLARHWSEIIARALVAHGEEGQQYKDALATMDEMLWSLAPKTQPEDKKRLVVLIPVLLRRLKQGMDSLQLEAADRESVLGALVESHTRAVKSTGKADDNAATGPLPDIAALDFSAPERDGDTVTVAVEDVVDRSSSQPAQIERRKVTRDGVQVDEVRLRPRAGRPAGADAAARDDCDAEVAALERGTWVDFVANDGSRSRSKLTWVSPRRTLYLFSNTGSNQSTAFSPEALALELRRGRAQVVRSDSPFDNAVQSIIEEFAGEDEA